MDHRRARSGRTDDRVGLTLLENADEAPRHLSCLVEITSIERGLRATSLPLIKLNFTPDASQHRDTTRANAGPHLVDETRDEK
jgi:hypothetical protein